MLKQLKKRKSKPFATYDIETAPNGELLCIGLYHPELINTVYFYSWKEFFNFLRLNNDEKHFQLLFAHNAGNFDAVSLIYWLLKENPDYDNDNCKIITTGSTVIFMEYSEFTNKIVFGDSVLTLKAPLKKLCEIFKPDTPKLSEFPIEMITQYFYYDPDVVLKYLDSDCKSLFQIMKRFMELMDIEFFPLTIASFSMYIYRFEYLKDFELYKPTKKQDEFITKSYAGGRVECFEPGLHESVYSFDINSLYPYIMSFAQIPVNRPPLKTSEFIKNTCGFYRIKFEQYNTDEPAVLWQKTIETGLTFVYKGEGTYSHHEIELAINIGTVIEVIEGYYFPETAIIFKDFVNHHYNERLNYKLIEKETGAKQPMEMILKLIMNSNYGKWAQKEESKHLEIMDTWQREKYLSMVQVIDINGEEKSRDVYNLENGDDPIMIQSENLDGTPLVIAGEKMMEYKTTNKIGIYDESLGLMEVTTKRDIDYRIIYLSSIITALARCELYKYLSKYKKDIIYCDTDSVHLKSGKCMNQGKLLGQMKKEESGAGVHIGRKMYAIKDDKPKIKYKGISNGSKLGGDVLTYEDMVKIYNQTPEQENDSEQVYKFKFNTFPKLKTCLKGQGKPAKKKLIIKELRKPEYTTNFIKA